MKAAGRDWDWSALRGDCRREVERLLRDHEEVEDAVQEAMARAWRRRDSCRSPGQARPWVRQIARNEALRLISRRRQHASLDATPELIAEAGHAPHDLDERLSVRRALSGLAPQDRLIAHLRYGEDLAQPRIADLLGMPEGTVKVRLHRIRKRLAPELADAG